MQALSFRFAAALVAILGLLAPSIAGEPNWPDQMTLGTASPGGTYYVYGEGVANILTRALDMPVVRQATEGPLQNIELIEAGQIQFGFVTMGVALQAWNASGVWTGRAPARAMRAIFPMYDTPFQFLVLQQSGIRSIADIAGKHVGVGPHGGTSATYAPQFFSVLNVRTRVTNSKHKSVILPRRSLWRAAAITLAMLAIGSNTYEEQSDVDGKRTFYCAINAAFCAGSGCPGWRCLRGRCRLSSCRTGWSRCWGCSWWCRRRGWGYVRSQSLLLSLSFLFLSQKTLLPSQKVFTPLGERIGLVKATSGIRRDSIPRQNCVTVPHGKLVQAVELRTCAAEVTTALRDGGAVAVSSLKGSGQTGEKRGRASP